MNSIGAAPGKIDKIYSNKPRLFNVGGNKQQYATQMPMMQWPNTNQYQQYQSTQYGSQYPSMMQQQQQFQQQPFQANWGGGGATQGYDLSSANGMQFQQQQQYQNQNYQQQQQQQDQQSFNNNLNQSNDQNTQKLSNFGQNKFDMRRMPPPPPPPPEMIQALMALTQNMQFNAGNGFAAQPPPQSASFMPPPPDYYRSGYESMNTNAMPMRTTGQRLKLTSHVYKNQNAPSAPLNPKFFKAGEKTQKVEKEKLYKPNTGYTIEEEETEKKEAVASHEPINIVIRGQDDLINSGVTTEMDEDDDDGQLAMLNPADRNYVQSKFLVSESITESQFKEELPKLFIDPKHAVTIEEQKILEKEKEEEEFQKKKEVFLVKSKYKILAEMEKEKSKKLMEKLLKKELDTVEARNREQELTLKIEGEQILKQKEQARDLEMIIKDIREERDYKMINKVLGINLEKPLDEIVDMEKIKADYAVEAMYKRNEELYEETNRLLRECDFYVDIDGRSYNTYHQKPIGEKSRSMARALIGMKGSDDDFEDDENSSQVYGSSHMKYSSSMGSSQKQQAAKAGGNMKNSGGNHSRVRFNNNSSKIPEAEEDEETQQKKQKQREFYVNLQKEVNNAQMKLDEMCESMHESQVEEDFEFSVNSIRRAGIPSSQKSIPSAQNQSVSKTIPKQQQQKVQQRQNSLNSKQKNSSQPNSKNSTIKKR